MSDYDPYDELPELPDDLILPPYLRQNGEGGMRTYGELSYNRRSRSWVIKGEPAVCQMAKRLFPGCDGKGRGVARFTANRRNTGDLNWLMLRYPLRIRETDALRWQEALEGAREFARARERARQAPQGTPRSAQPYFVAAKMPCFTSVSTRALSWCCRRCAQRASTACAPSTRRRCPG